MSFLFFFYRFVYCVLFMKCLRPIARLLVLIALLFAAPQWLFMPSAPCTSRVWWSDSCWPWLQWCACYQPSPSPACSSTTWETTRKRRTRQPRTAATTTTRGTQEIYTIRSLDRFNLLSFKWARQPRVYDCMNVGVWGFFSAGRESAEAHNWAGPSGGRTGTQH